MRIGTPGHRASDRIMQAFVSKQLGIPETEADLPVEKTASTIKTAACDCPKGCKCASCDCHKSAAKHTAVSCPECGSAMARRGNMERCACGYAQATAAAQKTANQKRKASETSVTEYYKKIFPDDYVNELTGKPDSGDGGEKVEYGHVDINKPVGDVGVKAHRVSARQVLAEDGAGDCEVPDKDPTPPDQKPNGSANEAGDAKMMGGESANSVGGPEDMPKGEKPNGSANEAGEVKTPDLGVPSKAATRKRAVGSVCAKCGTALDQSGQCPTCNGSAEQAQAQASRKMLSREQVAALCPSCADEMKRQGVKAISAEWLAKSIAGRAQELRTARK